MKENHFLKFTVLLIALSNPSLELDAQDTRHVILAGKLIDVIKKEIIHNTFIVVDNDTIADIFPAVKNEYPKDYIDLTSYTVLPGLIDCHTHLTMNSHDKSFDVYELPIASHGIIGVVNAEKTLLAGFTTTRDLWGNFYSDVSLRHAIENKIIPGPRMYVSGPAITITGGHGDWNGWMGPPLELKQNPAAIADGKDEIQKQVRLHIKNKVDVIKIVATGGFSGSSIPGAASYSIEELKTAVDEASKHGLKVAAHAHGSDGIKNAIKAGVASIEHGTFLDDEAINMMKANQVFLVMDLLGAYYELVETNEDFSHKKLSENNNSSVYHDYEKTFKNAYTQDVKMAFGTDAGVFPHGRNAEQFRLMKDADMDPWDIIRSATISAAELIGIENQAGSIHTGKWADIIAVKGNPLEDITVLENVGFVMKNGIIYKSN